MSVSDAPPELLSLMPDFRMHLPQPAELPDADLSRFQSDDFGPVMGCLRGSGGKEALTRLVHGMGIGALGIDICIRTRRASSRRAPAFG